MNAFKVFEKISEIVGWILIVFSFTAASALVGAILYYLKQTVPVLLISIIIAIAGFVLGVLLATKMLRTKGTVWFISRASASPELDNLDEEQQH